jgi:hypothetical protein
MLQFWHHLVEVEKCMVRSVLLCLFAVCLTGCLTEAQNPSPRLVTATPDRISTQTNSTLPPLNVSVQQPMPESADAVPAPPLPPKPCTEERIDDPTTQYTVNATLDWTTHSIQAEQQVQYTNTTGSPQEDIVFQIEPNRQSGFFIVNSVTMDERQVDLYALDRNRLTIPLLDGLGVDCTTMLTLDYILNIPPVLGGYADGRVGYYGFTDRQLNLGNWMPLVALYGQDWYVPQPTFIGEQSMADMADFDVTMTLENVPPTVRVVGPGDTRITDTLTWNTTLESARDVTLSIGDGFQKASMIADNGTVIDLYYYPDLEPDGFDTTQHTLQAAADSLILYEDLFNMEYPYERLVVVQGDFPDGMEFSGLVFVSRDWFTSWRGQQNSWLTIITVHEVAHQWWYLVVGNDPTSYPYLDEAFATYSEYLYYEALYPELMSWWWDFRIAPHELEGAVDSDVYRYGDSRPYINAVYLRGAQMLHSVRREIGDDAFFDWLASYADNYTGSIASAADLWSELPGDLYGTLEPLRQLYFERWGIVPTPSPTPSQ